MEVVWGRKMCLITLLDDTWILPALALQEIHNKLCDHISVLIYAHFAAGTYLPPEAYDQTLQFIKELHRQHLAHPKAFFELAGSIEGLCIGILIERHEKWDNHEFLDAVIDAIQESFAEARESSISRTSKIMSLLQGCNSVLIAELACLSKMSGHPITETEKGMEKLYDRVNKERKINVAAVAHTTLTLLEGYVREYFITHQGSYPPVSLAEECHPRIRQAFLTNKDINDPSLDYLGSISVMDWNKVTLLEHVSVDYLENMLPYLKDTALSLPQNLARKVKVERSEVLKSRDKYLERGLLMYVMGNEDHLDHVEYIKKFANREIPIQEFHNSFAIKLVEKEKELKLFARFFGCQTYKERCKNQVILQHCKKFLERYSCHQALVVSELELLKKLYSFSKMEKGEKGMEALTMSIDVKAWNNNFSTATVGPPLNKVLDASTGSNLFSRAHESFEHSLVYNTGPEKTLYWEGQTGGIEGLQQEAWMIVYIEQLRYALRDCAYRYDILCKGDDVRIRFLVPNNDVKAKGMPLIKTNLRTMVGEGLAEFGHTLKINESYASSVAFAFSKKLYLMDVALPSSYRQIQKCYGSNNAFLNTLDEYVASAFSNAHSATGYGINQFAPYIVALFWALHHILSYPIYEVLSDTEVMVLLLVPSALGGFPIIYLHNMFVRAESDLVAAFTGLALWVRQAYPSLWPAFRKYLEYPIDRSASIKLLLADAYSLPIARPSGPKPKLVRRITTMMKHKSRNPMVKGLFSREVEDFDKAICLTLQSADYYDAKLSSAVYECTPMAIQDQFIQKFTSAKSMINALLDTGYSHNDVVTLLRSMQEAEVEVHRWRQARIKTFQARRCRIEEHHLTCPTVLAEHLREEGWGFKVHSITYPPVQHQVFVCREEEAQLEDADSHFVYTVANPIKEDNDLPYPHFAKSLADPFLGHTTPSGTVGAPITIDSPNVIINNIKKLLMLYTSVFLEHGELRDRTSKTFADLILKVLSCYTPLKLDDLNVFQNKRRSGTRTHHMAIRGYRLQILPNQIKNMMSHVTATVNTYASLRVTSVNYRLNFLQLMCHTTCILMMNWSMPATVQNAGRFWAMIPPCEQCFTPIDEKNTFFGDDAAFREVSPQPDCLMTGIRGAHDLINAYITNQEETTDFRQFTDDIPTSIEEAQVVLAAELTKITIRDHQALSVGYSVIRPTVEAMRDLVKLKGRAKLQRSLTGSEVAKIPGKVLAQELIPLVLEFIYSSRRFEDFHTIIACFATYDAQALPWAPFLYQCQKHGKLTSLVHAICVMFDKPLSDAGSSCLDYVSASRFVAIWLSSWYQEEYPDSLMTIHAHSFLPSSVIHHRVRSLLVAKAHWMSRKATVDELWEKKIVDGELVIYESEASLLPPALLQVLYRRVIPVDHLRTLLAQTSRVHILDPFETSETEIWHNLAEDWQMLEPVTKNIITRWARQWDISGEDFHKGLQNGMEKELDEEVPASLQITIRFHDLAECFSTLRATETPHDMDDHYQLQDDPECPKALDLMHLNLSAAFATASEIAYSPPHGTADPGLAIHETSRAIPAAPTPDMTHLRRAWGTLTTSCVKLEWILRQLAVYRRWNAINPVFCCLADGEGGDSRFLLDNYHDSVVVWNSLQSDDHPHVPVACKVQDEVTGTSVPHPRLIYAAQMNLGGDLTRGVVQRALLAIHTRYNLVKCDADLPKDHTRSHVAAQIWSFCTQLWLARSSSQGILLVKVFMDIPDTVAWFVESLRAVSSSSMVLVNPMSHIGYEAYVIAINPIHGSPFPLYATTVRGTVRGSCNAIYDLLSNQLQDHDRGKVTKRELLLSKVALPPKGVKWPAKFKANMTSLGLVGLRSPTLGQIQTALKTLMTDTLRMTTTDQTEHMLDPGSHDTITHKVRNLHTYLYRAITLTILERHSKVPFADQHSLTLTADVKVRVLNDAQRILDSPVIRERFCRKSPPITLDQTVIYGVIRLGLREEVIRGSKVAFEIIAGLLYAKNA